MIGYIYSSYAARPLDQVKADVDRYDGFYTLDGFFIDEVTNDANEAHLDYYAALYEGLWRSLGLLSMFSITFLAARFVFLFLGWRLATALMHFTDIPKQMRNGQIGVADSEIPVAAI